MVWKITPLFANWISSKANIFLQTDLLSSHSTVLELGCGVSGIVALALSRHVGRFIATDQEYVFKLLKSNLKENAIRPSKSGAPQRGTKRKPKTKSEGNATLQSSNIEIVALDWETSLTSSLPDLLGSTFSSSASREVDVVLACDCIYNEALIDPFVQTCVDLCNLPKADPATCPTICIIAQQLRSHIVFETWLLAFHAMFRVWRVPDHVLDTGLVGGSGYVIHVAILREVTGV